MRKDATIYECNQKKMIKFLKQIINFTLALPQIYQIYQIRLIAHVVRTNS